MKRSVLLSKILCYILYVIIAAAIFLIPTVMRIICTGIGFEEKLPYAISLLYLSLPPALTATLFLHKLLLNIEKENVFCERNIKYLRILAWCCFGVGVMYFAAGFIFTTAFLVSFAAFFFFFIIRVIRNVFDAACEIKEENDYTV